jgi:hypothetical protein
MSMHVKVALPTGEVNVKVDPNSTPGHLKENLKYSLGVPPKCITLLSEGRALDDIKPLCGEPNNLQDGAVIVPEVDKSILDKMDIPEATKKPVASSSQPTVIKKEEPPKPKKPKKDVVRPTVGEKDVVKKEVLSPGHLIWKQEPSYMEGQSKFRHMALLRIKAVDENKTYPEQDDGAVHVAMGDPQTSPAWTAAATQMEVGEKAVFAMTNKVVDFDPEGLTPTDFTATWQIELLNVFTVEDVNQDYSQLLLIDEKGDSSRAEDLDRVAVHWRVRRWMAEGMFCIASSRERIAIMPGYGLVPIEDVHAPPVGISVGEGQQEAVEIIAARVGKGGKGHIYLKSTALTHNRPNGTVVIDVELVELDPCKGPGSPGWKGWASLMHEIEQGDRWLEEADERRKQLETFDTMRKTTDDVVGSIKHVSDQVHKFAFNAVRRYRRSKTWLGADNQEQTKVKVETANVKMKLAKAQALNVQRFGPAQDEKPTEEEVNAIKDARELLAGVLKLSEELDKEPMKYECLKMSLQLAIQAEDVKDGKGILEQLQTMRPGDESLKSDSARLNRLTTAMELKQGAGSVEELQLELRAAVEAKDKPVITEKIGALYELMKNNQVKYDVVIKLKVGKDVGNAMKLGDPDLAKAGRLVVSEIQRLAQNAGLGL